MVEVDIYVQQGRLKMLSLPVDALDAHPEHLRLAVAVQPDQAHVPGTLLRNILIKQHRGFKKMLKIGCVFLHTGCGGKLTQHMAQLFGHSYRHP